MDYQRIFDVLWQKYIAQNPSSKRIYDLFIREGEKVINDHIAFRTFNHPSINIEVLAGVFIKNGYEEKGSYVFEEKKLFARHYEHVSDPDAPRVFISELLTERFSDHMRKVVNEWVAAIPTEVILSEELIHSGNVSGIPSYKIYEKLRLESEYAGWLYVNGFCANHFTVSVNRLHEYDSIEKVNRFLKSNGFLLNGGDKDIQGTPQELLEQSSIRAGINRVMFQEGEFDIPGCYYEFARRYPDNGGALYSGFIAKSADKIFESTNFYKK